MGLLFKLILFGIVIYYIVKTIGGFIFKILGVQPRRQAPQQTAQQRREGEIKIEYAPKDKKTQKKNAGSKGGDYIDYEEVK
jgi:hypothetical protein